MAITPQVRMAFLTSVAFLVIFSSIRPAMGSTFVAVPFQPDQNVDLEVEYSITYTPKYPTSSSLFEMWVPRLSNLTNDATSGPTFQNATLKNQETPDYWGDYSYDPSDVYGNAYDFYNMSFSSALGRTTFQVNSTYEVTLSSHEWDIPSNLTLDDYDRNSSLYQQYTANNPMYETNDSLVVSTLAGIIGTATNLKTIVEDVFLYDIETLNYTLSQEVYPASDILTQKYGDCSEFSTLMISLLRAAGIPARKVLGIGLIDGPVDGGTGKYNMKPGDRWYYDLSQKHQIPGHAWVQYYIPGLGWLSADPTWAQPYLDHGEASALQYLYKMDYIHLATTIGGWYGEGIDPELFLDKGETGVAEFPFIYPVLNALQYSLDFRVSFKVLDTSYYQNGLPTNFVPYLVGLAPVLMVAVVIVVFIRKRSKQSQQYY